MGASDIETEKIWLDSETGEDVTSILAMMWAAGQPNGERVQNCASIWETTGKGKNRWR